MTVSELIDELKKLNPQMPVFIDKQNNVRGHIYSSEVRLAFPLMRHLKHGKIVQRPCAETTGARRVLVL